MTRSPLAARWALGQHDCADTSKSAICRKKYVHPVFERAITYLNDVGLLAQEVDPATGELLGNFPQVFSHIGGLGEMPGGVLGDPASEWWTAKKKAVVET